MAIATVDPNTGNTIRTFQPHTDAQLEEKLARAVVGARLQRELPIAERAKRMARAAEILHVRREELGRLMTLEMGKLKNAALAEVDKCALGCRYYADHGAAFMADEPVKTDAARSMIRYQPLGVVLAVMPWNFPLWQVFRFAAPGLVAGNAAVLKHASNVPQCALAIEDVFRAAGFPDGAFQTLLGLPKYSPPVSSRTTTRSVPCSTSSRMGEALMSAGLTLTGRRLAYSLKP